MRKVTVITKEMTINGVIQKYPKTVFVFIDHGLHCVGCPASPEETIEEAAQVHRLDLAKLLDDLNQAAN